jgi:hypothetical protein
MNNGGNRNGKWGIIDTSNAPDLHYFPYHNDSSLNIIDLSENINFLLLDACSRKKSSDNDCSTCSIGVTCDRRMANENSINVKCDMSSNMSNSLTPRSRKQQSLVDHLDSKTISRAPRKTKDASTEPTLSDFRALLSFLDDEYSRTTNNDKNFSGWEVNSEPERCKGRRKRLYVDATHNYEAPQAKKPDMVREKVNIDVEINGLKDLLKLIDDHPLADNIDYNINMEVIHKIKSPLQELDSMIGMSSLKNNVVDQIIYYMQNFHTMGKCNGDFMHTVIYGPPGTGKTEIAKIIGKIFSKLDVLKKGTFKKVTRTDLVAGYLGQTAMKTRDVVRSGLGGVLFIDEAYALGNADKRDSFAKECIDTLCEALSDHKDNIMVIIAGYEKELKECFFNYNQGLESRFTWRFKTDDYSAAELREIFIKKVIDAGWRIDASIVTEGWFKDNECYFKYYGRDMETLFAKTKISHSRRVFCKPDDKKTSITIDDINNGFKLYLNNDEVKSRKEDSRLPSMYV